MNTEYTKIIIYTLDEKTYRSLELQFKRDYIYNIVLSKLIEQLNK